jgi:DNA-binding beta-propeller fold protein YncE
LTALAYFISTRILPRKNVMNKNMLQRVSKMLLLASSVLLSAIAGAASPQLIFSTQDGKVMSVNGVIETVPGADTLAIIEITPSGARLLHEIAVPNTVFGPPQSLDITPDGRLALVAAGAKRDPADPGKTALDDRISVLDLRSNPPRVIDTVHAGLGVGGLSISPDGKLALAANRDAGTVSVFSIAGQRVSLVENVMLGATSGPGHVVFTPDGKRALVTRDGDHRVTLLDIDGAKVRVSKRDIFPGQRPNGIDISPRGDVAVVANIGKGQGDTDTISLIDMTLEPPRVVNTVSVGQTPEGIAISPDGRLVGVDVMNGSNKAENSPFYNKHGSFVLFRIDGKSLSKVSEVPIGGWSQGVAFSADGRTVLVQNPIEREIQVLAIDGDRASDTGQRLKFAGAPGGMRAFRPH